MAERDPEYPIPPFPQQLTLQDAEPQIWGISFDIYYRRSIDPLPGGWGSNSSYIYTKLRSMLRARNFIPSQYSDYRSEYPCGAWFSWVTMFHIMSAEPPGRMETTVRRLRMHSIVELNLQDVSEEVKLGGVYSRRVRGPMPAGLVAPVAHLLLIPQNMPLTNPPQHVLPPVGTKPTAQSLNRFNWIT